MSKGFLSNYSFVGTAATATDLPNTKLEPYFMQGENLFPLIPVMFYLFDAQKSEIG